MSTDVLPAAELVLRFLQSVGRPAEAEQYLALFRSENPESFAVIHVSAPVMEHAFDALMVALRFLSNLGLCPIVTFGAVTESSRGRNAKRAAERVKLALGDEDPAEVCDLASAAALTRKDVIALVPLDASIDGDDARFDQLTQLVNLVKASKLIFVGRRSGLQPRGGAVVSMLDVATEVDELSPQLAAPQRALLRQVGRVFANTPHALTVHITSPMDLLRELFTVKGAGTLVRRAARIHRYTEWAQLDRQALGALVTQAFGKPIAPHFFDHGLAQAYVADAYRGAAIVTDSPLGPYLSKFAVTTVARGEGIGRDLWRALGHDFPSIFWKSRTDNPITAWYREQCDGLQRVTIDGVAWTVLWRGVPAAKLAAMIDYCLSLPPDFLPLAKT